MAKHVIPKETGTEQLGVVRPLSEEQRRRAALKVARAAVNAGHSRDATVELLQMLGLVDDRPSPARVDAIGQTIYPTARKREAS